MMWSASEPCRPKDWRLRRAKYLITTGIRPCRTDDKFVQMAYKYLKKHAKLDDLVASGNPVREHRYRQRLYEKFPDLYRAHYFWRDEEHLLRYALESLIVAGAGPEFLTPLTCLPAESIEAYEAVFFDLRSRREATLFVMHETMSSAAVFGMTDTDKDALWKMYGLFAGKEFLMTVLSRGGPLTPEMVDMTARVISADMQRNALIGATTRPLDRYKIADVMQEYLQNKQIDVAAEGEGSGQGRLNELVNGMLTALASCLHIRGAPVSVLEGRAALPIKQLADGANFGNQDQRALPGTVMTERSQDEHAV